MGPTNGDETFLTPEQIEEAVYLGFESIEGVDFPFVIQDRVANDMLALAEDGIAPEKFAEELALSLYENLDDYQTVGTALEISRGNFTAVFDEAISVLESGSDIELSPEVVAVSRQLLQGEFESAEDYLASLANMSPQEAQAAYENLTNYEQALVSEEIGPGLPLGQILAERLTGVYGGQQAEYLATLSDSDRAFLAEWLLEASHSHSLKLVDDPIRQELGLPTHAELIAQFLAEESPEIQALGQELAEGWDAEQEEILLEDLRTRINAMPTEVVGVPIPGVKAIYEQIYQIAHDRFLQLSDLQSRIDYELYMTPMQKFLKGIMENFYENSAAWREDSFSAVVGSIEGIIEMFGFDISALDYATYGPLAPYAMVADLLGMDVPDAYEILGLPSPSEVLAAEYNAILAEFGVDRKIANDAQFGGNIGGFIGQLVAGSRFFQRRFSRLFIRSPLQSSYDDIIEGTEPWWRTRLRIWLGRQDIHYSDFEFINQGGFPEVAGRNKNCVFCSLALDQTLAGNPAFANPSAKGMVTSRIEMYYAAGAEGRRHFEYISNNPRETMEIIKRILLEAGDGSRGLVTSEGHIWNAVNEGGQIRFIDAQRNIEGADVFLTVSGRHFEFLRTDDLTFLPDRFFGGYLNE